MSTHRLHCFTHNTLIGTVSYEANEDAFAFEYDAAWLHSPDAYPLSPHIPLAADASAKGAAVRRFLANLLPEGRALDITSIVAQVSKNNVFGLIRELGSEPVGAFSFRTEDQVPDQLPPLRREITPEELDARIRDRANVPLPVWDGRVRLSVAGYQDKLQVLIDSDRMFLADGSLASTHILKPETGNPNTPHMVANEHFCMTFAARLGLPVAPVSIRRLPEPILLVRRFDRKVSGDAIRRIHAIDGCQALDLPVAYKYERNLGSGRDVRNIRDGVSFELLSSLQSHFVKHAAARHTLMQWALLQFLIGNSDAHGKNISFFVTPSGLAPAPFYDLVAVGVYAAKSIGHDLAMAFGDEFSLTDVNAYAFADFAQRTGVDRRFLAREMTRIGKLAPQVARAVSLESHYTDGEREIVERIADFIATQASKLIGLAPRVPEIDAALL
ncbi:HipA domain-containing protein [Caballeronia humi]|uniref:HipA domain-containing protein n=1 Tax=Caballeronia humi TaxID=326474 RepID=A0A158F428_9BURK|nr:HipA domain-containing protein [Caballeronia humi]SAL14109.1 HipA domain-containing protein [Caballeronia humi]